MLPTRAWSQSDSTINRSHYAHHRWYMLVTLPRGLEASVQHVRCNFRSKSGRGASPCLSCWWLDMRELSSSPHKTQPQCIIPTLLSNRGTFHSTSHNGCTPAASSIPRFESQCSLAVRCCIWSLTPPTRGATRQGNPVRKNRIRAAGHAVYALLCVPRLVISAVPPSSLFPAASPWHGRFVRVSAS